MILTESKNPGEGWLQWPIGAVLQGVLVFWSCLVAGFVTATGLAVWSVWASVNEFVQEASKATVCAVCYEVETVPLAGSKFKTCGHGNQLCGNCNRKCATCPLCRKEKDKPGAVAKKLQFGLVHKSLSMYSKVDWLIAISFFKFCIWSWESKIAEDVCKQNMPGDSSWYGCGPCITSGWMGCVHGRDFWTTMPMYVSEMLCSPVYWLLVVMWWATLRWDDTQWIIPDSLLLRERGLKAEVKRTKTTGKDEKVQKSFVFVSKTARFSQENCLTCGWQLCSDASFPRDFPSHCRRGI